LPPFIGQRSKRGGDNLLIAVMLNTRDLVDIAFTVLACAGHEQPEKRRCEDEEFVVVPAWIEQIPTCVDSMSI
jgi:hypothetical protein